jgi:hypothetical protein
MAKPALRAMPALRRFFICIFFRRHAVSFGRRIPDGSATVVIIALTAGRKLARRQFGRAVLSTDGEAQPCFVPADAVSQSDAAGIRQRRRHRARRRPAQL